MATTKKAPIRATRAKAAPAKKVEAPAKAPPPEEASDTGSAPAPDTASGTAAAGLTETTAPAEAKQADKMEEPAGETVEEAYKRGYTEGFSAALDDLADDSATEPGETDTVEAIPYAGSTGSGYDRTALIALSLYTPENQRKGGISVVVDRLQAYLDGLDPDDRWPAIQFMHAIAQTKPLDLANGRFQRVIAESLAALNGDPLSNETAADRGEQAAERFARAFPQEDEKEPAPGAEGLAPDFDPDDPESGAAAAARLAGA